MSDDIEIMQDEVITDPTKREKGRGFFSAPSRKAGVVILLIMAVILVVRNRFVKYEKIIDDLRNNTMQVGGKDQGKTTASVGDVPATAAAVVPMTSNETTIVAAGVQTLRIDRITAIDMKGENIKVSPVVAVPFRQYVKYTGGDGKWVYLNTVYPGPQRPHDTIDSKIQTMGYQLVAGYGLTETKLAYCLYVGKPPAGPYWYQLALYRAGILGTVAQSQ